MKKFLAGLFVGLLIATASPALAGIHGQFQGLDIVKLLINGREVQSDTPAVILGSRTLVPVRFVSEVLGATVNWNEHRQEVSITLPPIVIKNPEPLTTVGPIIQGSQAFKEEVREALELLKDKTPEDYRLVNGFLKYIVDSSDNAALTTRVLKNAFAITDSEAGYCDMNWKLFKDYSQSLGLSSEERCIFMAALLVHEATHVYTRHQNICDALSPLEWEVLSYARGRQTLNRLNAPKRLVATSSVDYVIDTGDIGKWWLK